MTTNWTSTVYSQERKVVTINNFNANTAQVRLSLFSPVNAISNYVVPTSRELQIDVTDIVRLANVGTFFLSGYDASGNFVSGESVTCGWSTAGLINPYQDIKPLSDLLQVWTAIADAEGEDVGVTIAPPSLILEPAGTNTVVEMWATSDIEVADINHTLLFDSGTHQINIPTTRKVWYVRNDGAELEYGQYGVSERTGCNKACAVRWISRYGVQKQFAWYYKDQRVNVSEVVSIATIDGTYNERKGYEQGLTLFLDELNAYDYWYYSDIVTSSKVEVLLGGVWRVVQVDVKNVQIPNNDTGKPKDLEVQINLQGYDAI